MIAQQRAQLAVGRDEIARIDSRVMELQERLERKRMMNQQLAIQISAATSAKQEQLRAIQQSMMGGGGAAGKNKNKPVSTVEPFQRQPHGGGAVPKVEDLHNSINKNHHGQQPYMDDKDAKYQTLPFGSRYNNNGGLNKKDLQNVRFSEAPTSVADYQRSYNISTDHQGNYPLSNDNNNSAKSSSLKPTSSVAPVVMQQQQNPSRESSPDDLSMKSKMKPALPPKPMTSQSDRNGSVSPPPYIPAPPPGSSSTPDSSPENADSSITILRSSGKGYPNGQHPSEEGTSVDDDMPSEEDDEHSGASHSGGSNGGGLTVMPNVHISINRRIEMPPAFHFPENQPPPSDLLSGHQVTIK